LVALASCWPADLPLSTVMNVLFRKNLVRTAAIHTAMAFTLSAGLSAYAQQQPATPAKPVDPDSKPVAPPTEELPDSPTPQAAALIHPNGPVVVFDTSMGRITCQFYEKQAPKTVANFIGLAEGTIDWTDPDSHKKMHHKRLYDGTIFHRVIPGFMAQGGDPAGTGMGDPGYAFDDEFDPNLNFDRPGLLAMANSGPNTDGSQFFITEQAYDSLDQHYTLFGQCDDAGVEVVKAITHVERDGQDKPLTPVVLRKVTIVRDGAPIPPPPADAATASPAAKPVQKPN
jgi:peptidyl-prolyl cis-trans isomerase A (cyclophilin A)